MVKAAWGLKLSEKGIFVPKKPKSITKPATCNKQTEKLN